MRLYIYNGNCYMGNKTASLYWNGPQEVSSNFTGCILLDPQTPLQWINSDNIGAYISVFNTHVCYLLMLSCQHSGEPFP